MASTRQRGAARRNVRKAASAVALGKQANKVKRQKARSR